MRLTRQKVIDARKSVIALPDTIFCLGSIIDVSTAGHPVVTSVNQTILHGDVRIKYHNGKTEELRIGQKITSTEISDVAHDGFVYSFPQSKGQSVTVELSECAGSWKTINNGGSPETVKGQVFSVWVNHGKGRTESYLYQIRCVDINDVTRLGQSLTNTVMGDATNAHLVVSSDGSRVVGTVFHPGDNLWIDLADSVSICPLAPVSLIATAMDNGKLAITCADLSQKLQEMQFKVSQGSANRSSLDKNQTSKSITVPLPAGDDAGKSTTAVWQIN